LAYQDRPKTAETQDDRFALIMRAVYGLMKKIIASFLYVQYTLHLSAHVSPLLPGEEVLKWRKTQVTVW
jgi:hypothetical protein